MMKDHTITSPITAWWYCTMWLVYLQFEHDIVLLADYRQRHVTAQISEVVTIRHLSGIKAMQYLDKEHNHKVIESVLRTSGTIPNPGSQQAITQQHHCVWQQDIQTW